MSIVAETYQYLVGVDTHAATHTLAVINAGSGALIATDTFPTSPAGLNRAVTWIKKRTNGSTLLVVEGVGAYGALFTRVAVTAGYQVVEPFPTPAQIRRGRGKTDRLDAAWIAESVRAADTTELRQPRCDEPIRKALQVLVNARDMINLERTRAINQLTALIRTTGLGVDARQHLTEKQITQIAAWHISANADAASYARREATRLARRVLACNKDLAVNEKDLLQQVAAHPGGCLLDMFGVGPISAATIIVAWSHPGRIRSKAAFSALAGVSPIPASSGNTDRHRLNRGGDRRLNRALAAIVRTRLAKDPATQAYQAKRTAEGHTSPEIRRILKNYVARQVFKKLASITI